MDRDRGIKDSRFDVGAVLGRGGSAVVYEAIDSKTMRRVALKVLPDSKLNQVARARLAREARASLAVNHPNVCAMLDRGLLDDGRPYVAMELLQGETLRAYLFRKGRLEVEEALEIAVQMLAGLEAAHTLGFVHRDVKPENVFLVWDSGRPQVKLLDFGVCRRAADPLDDQTLTMTGFIVGTPGYIAPEQAYGDRDTDARVDLFGVGLILFEMLTGRPAFLGRTDVELVEGVTKRVPSVRKWRSVPTLLDVVVGHATERDPRVRYATAADFQHDLLEARTAVRREGSHSLAARKSQDCARGTLAPQPAGALELTETVAVVRPVQTETTSCWEIPTRRLSLDHDAA